MRTSIPQAVSGRPPVAVSMAVGQFFNPKEGVMEVSSQSMLLSAYWAKVVILKSGYTLPLHLQCFGITLVKQLVNWFQLWTNFLQEIFLKEDHPLAYNLSFAISLGLLPITLSLKTAGCGIKTFGLPDGETGDLDKDSKNSNPSLQSKWSFFP